jgi:ferredoxin
MKTDSLNITDQLGIGCNFSLTFPENNAIFGESPEQGTGHNQRIGIMKGVRIMASKADKADKNVDGPYYVDSDCIGCGICPEEAPENFKLDDEEQAYVFKQPENDEEKEQAEAALQSCPADAIGNDG